MALLRHAGTLVIRPGQFPIQLGDIVFSTEETPAKWSIGAGKQMLKTTDMCGGSRVVQDFGNSASKITMQGKFWGNNVPLRVKQFREYRISGEAQILSWTDEKYLVKIEEFDPGYKGRFNEFSLTLEVVQDLNGAFSVQSTSSVDEDVANIQAEAIVQQNGTSNNDPNFNNYQPPSQPAGQTVGQQLTNLWRALQSAAPLSQNIMAKGPAIVELANNAIAAISAYQGSIPPTSPQFPYTMALLGSLQAIVTNIQSAPAQDYMDLEGGELFSVAALQYGDLTQAFTVAQANGYVHPILPASNPTTIAIPTLQAA